MIQVILYILLWGFVIYANVSTIDGQNDAACDLTECQSCPFPCEKRANMIKGEQTND